MTTSLPRRAAARALLALAVGAFALVGSACSSSDDAPPAPSSAPSESPVDTRVLNSITVPSEVLAANLIGDPGEHDAMVYLPPQYFTTDDAFPVIYYLPGHGGTAMFGPRIPEDLDKAFATLEPAIIVTVSGMNSFSGSFYADSTTTGGWSTFLTDDVVPYVDGHFRTIPTREARGIAGHSMGGHGALDNAMRHSDVFGSVFALAPGVFDQNGLGDTQMFNVDDHIRGVIALIDEAKALGGDEGIALLANPNSNFDIGYGMAFAPSDVYPYFDYPFTLEGDTLVRDDAVWALWEGGFGGIEAESIEFADEWNSLLGIHIDCGLSDGYQWIVRGCAYLDAELTAAGVDHEYVTHPGDHGNNNRERIVDVMLPFFSEIFAEATA